MIYDLFEMIMYSLRMEVLYALSVGLLYWSSFISPRRMAVHG
jgi:hypothetical protein